MKTSGNKRSTGKDPIQLLEEADGHPQWLREALTKIFERLPPASPPQVKVAPPTWNPRHLASLQLDPQGVPLTVKDRWYLGTWLKNMGRELMEGTLEEGDSHEGFRTVFILGKDGGQG